jgi:hypothetical protein
MGCNGGRKVMSSTGSSGFRHEGTGTRHRKSIEQVRQVVRLNAFGTGNNGGLWMTLMTSRQSRHHTQNHRYSNPVREKTRREL